MARNEIISSVYHNYGLVSLFHRFLCGGGVECISVQKSMKIELLQNPSFSVGLYSRAVLLQISPSIVHCAAYRYHLVVMHPHYRLSVEIPTEKSVFVKS